MAIDWQHLNIPFTGPLDTKTAEFITSPPRLLQAQNVMANRPGSLRKRWAAGYLSHVPVDMAGSTVGGHVSMAMYKDNPVVFTDTKLYEWSNGASALANRGYVVAPAVSTYKLQTRSDKRPVRADCAQAGEIIVCVSGTTLFTGGVILATCLDSHGTVLWERTLSSNGSNPRCVARGSRVYVFYGDNSTSEIKALVVDTTSRSTVNAAETAAPVVVVAAADTSFAAGEPVYDVANNETYGVFIAYRQATANTIKHGFVSPGGVLSSTTTFATVSANAALIAVSVESGDARHAIAYTQSTDPSDVYCKIQNWNGSTWSTTATSTALDTAIVAGADVESLAVAWDSPTTARVYHSVINSTISVHPNTYVTYQGTLSTSGTTSGKLLAAYHGLLASKVFTYNAEPYYLLMAGNTINSPQPFLALYRASDNALMGWLLPGEAYFWYQPSFVQNYSGNKFRLAAPYRMSVLAASGFPPRETGVKIVEIDFDSVETRRCTELGDVLYIPGPVLLQYDGVGVIESNFLEILQSDYVVATPGTGGSMTPGAAVSYMILPYATNARGEPEYGTNTGPVNVTAASMSGKSKVTLSIPTIAHTRKNVVFKIYRTKNNPGEGAIYHHVGDVANDPSVNLVTYEDTTQEVAILSRAQYFYSDGELDHVAPPPSHIACAGGGRLFLATEDGYVWASKLRLPGEAIAFSDALKFLVPDEGGRITAMSVMDESLIIFKERRIYRVRNIGQFGPSNIAGAGGEFGEPQLISADSGTKYQHSVIQTPEGIMFRAERGFYLLTRAFELVYIGSALENEPTGTLPVRASALVTSEHHVRFALNDAVHVYDYLNKQWFVWTYPSMAVGMASWINPPSSTSPATGAVWTDGTSLIYESRSLYRDFGNVGIQTSVRLGWIKGPGGLQDDVRFRRYRLVYKIEGLSQNPGYLYIDVHGNYGGPSPAGNDPGPFIQNNTFLVTGSNVEYAEARLNRQIFEAISFDIYEHGSLLAFTLLGLNVEVGVRSGMLSR